MVIFGEVDDLLGLISGAAGISLGQHSQDRETRSEATSFPSCSRSHSLFYIVITFRFFSGSSLSPTAPSKLRNVRSGAARWRRRRPGRQLQLRHVPLRIRLLQKLKPLDDGLRLNGDGRVREFDFVLPRAEGRRRLRHRDPPAHTPPNVYPGLLMRCQDAEDDIQLLQVLELQQAEPPEQLWRVVNPHIPPGVTVNAKAPCLEHAAGLVERAAHPRPHLIDEDAIAAGVEIVDGQRGLYCFSGDQQSLVAELHFMSRFCACVEEVGDVWWAGLRRRTSLGDDFARLGHPAIVDLSHQVDGSRGRQRIPPYLNPQLRGQLSKAWEARRRCRY